MLDNIDKNILRELQADSNRTTSQIGKILNLPRTTVHNRIRRLEKERLEKELGGYLLGKPKILLDNELNMDFLNKQDGYYVEIEITELKIST